jgi:hypothetical protein
LPAIVYVIGALWMLLNVGLFGYAITCPEEQYEHSARGLATSARKNQSPSELIQRWDLQDGLGHPQSVDR